MIYCAKMRPYPGLHSGSRSHRGLGRQSQQIMWEYDLATVIVIRPLIQPCTYKMIPSIFLPLVDSNSQVVPGIPFQAWSIDRTNRETFSLRVRVKSCQLFVIIIHLNADSDRSFCIPFMSMKNYFHSTWSYFRMIEGYRERDVYASRK